MIRPALAAALGVLLLLAPAAGAQDRKKGRTIYQSPLLWSTVNVCDSKRSPDTIGIRASMPGSGRRGEKMFMRFQVQYRSKRDGLWHNFVSGQGTDSGRIKVGSAKFKSRRAGWEFPFMPDKGERFVLRGVVTFEWRKRGKLVRRAKKKTEKGHRTPVAEPRRYSAATCVIRG